MEDESLRQELVEFLIENREEIVRTACDSVYEAYPYMPTLASSKNTQVWVLSEVDVLINAFARNDPAALDYKGFYAYFIVYASEPFRSLFNYLDWTYLISRVILSFAYEKLSPKGARTRSVLRCFESFVLEVLRQNMGYFIGHALEPGFVVGALDPAVAPQSQAKLGGGYLKSLLLVA